MPTLQELEADILAKIRETTSEPTLIDLGCGYVDLPPGFVGVDAYAKGDRIRNHDLFGSWPFGNESVDLFTSSHFVEHVPDWDHHFAEIWRCLKPGGHYRFVGPYAKSDRYLQDPDHKQPLTEARLGYLQQAWLRANKIEQGRKRLNFSVVNVGYWWHADLEDKNEEARQWALAHTWNAVNDIFVILRKEPLLED